MMTRFDEEMVVGKGPGVEKWTSRTLKETILSLSFLFTIRTEKRVRTVTSGQRKGFSLICRHFSLQKILFGLFT